MHKDTTHGASRGKKETKSGVGWEPFESFDRTPRPLCQLPAVVEDFIGREAGYAAMRVVRA